jgi:hypothetical protein
MNYMDVTATKEGQASVRPAFWLRPCLLLLPPPPPTIDMDLAIQCYIHHTTQSTLKLDSRSDYNATTFYKVATSRFQTNFYGIEGLDFYRILMRKSPYQASPW